MPKILAQAGVSLADNYDIEGSIAGVDELETRNVSLVHEMGAQIHSERLNQFIVKMTSGDVLQSTAFAILASAVPDTTNRILGLALLANTAARVTHASLAYRNPDTNREFVLACWDTSDDAERRCLYSDDGAAAAEFFYLSPTIMQSPHLLARIGTGKLMPQLLLRGQTEAFGAGTVETLGLVVLAAPGAEAPTPGAPSSHGLPLPGW